MRKVLFWLHLTAGSVAGVVILIMSLTGVALAFERQINAWADSNYRSSSGGQGFALESIGKASNITVAADPDAPLAVNYGREKLVYLDRGSAMWFRGGLIGKARDWNWHNTVGIWSAIPLFLIVLSSVIMSYGWANNLLYTLTGTTQAPPQSPSDGARKGQPPGTIEHALPLAKLMEIAGAQTPGWKTISFRPPSSVDRTLVLNVDAGSGGQPQKRAQLTMNRETGTIARAENFATNNAGRQLRLIARFLHTGEILGWPGQVIATIATFGGAILVWTGISLAIRRAGAMLKRMRANVPMKTAA